MGKAHVSLIILLIFTLALPASPVGAQAPTQNPPTPNTLFLPLVQQAAATTATIDPRVLADTADGQVGHFLVLLTAQAHPDELVNAATAYAVRGALVVDALQQVAAATQAPVAAQLDSLGASYRAYWVANFFAVTGNRAVVEAMAARSDVQAIEADRAFQVPLEAVAEVNDATVAAVGWNLDWVGAPAVWALGATGQTTVYANADTGVQWNHPALQGHYRGWNGTAANHNYSWWDAIHADLDGNGNPCGFALRAPCDDNGHGTHTTGTGVGDDGAGNQIGVAPGAKWIACRNMDAGVGRPSTYIECMQFFLAPTDLNGNNPDPSKRPDVVGNSYGCPAAELCTPNSLLTAMNSLRAAGIFMAVSAGNSGAACATVNDPPGIYDSAITVGATGNQTDSIASYSSRGPVTVDGSGRAKPDLVAPGSSVRSAYVTNSYATLNGTSMAAPHVAGAVALLWSAFPALRGNVDQTEALLKQTAVRLTTSQGCGGDSPTQIPNNVYGYGRLNILAAYQAVAPVTTPTPTSTPPTAPTATPTPTPTPLANNTGFLSPTANRAQTRNAGDNNGYEVNPANAHSDGGGVAQDLNSGTNNNATCTVNGKDKHHYTNYNISLPTGATVTGITVRLDALVDMAANAPAICVQLSWNGGTSWTAAKQTPTLTTTETTYLLGGAMDSWGRTWKATNLRNQNFLVRVSNVAAGAGATARDFSLDWVAVQINYR